MKKSLGIFLAATLAFSTFAGCGAKKTDVPTSGTETKTEEKKSDKPKVLRQTSGKFKTLNQHNSETQTDSRNASLITGSLVTMILNEKGDSFEFVGNHAKDKPTKSEDGKTWTFKLRDNITWDDGTPIDAETYIYSYKMLLDPKLKNRNAQTFFDSVTVKNAEKYFKGECEWDQVGIKAPDKHTLQIELEFPTMDLEVLKTFEDGSVGPVHQKIYDKYMNEEKTETKYGTSIETSPSSGAYKIKEWKQDQLISYEKRQDSPMAKIYVPDTITRQVVEDSNTELQLFEKGEIDYVSLTGAQYDKYKEDPRVKIIGKDSSFCIFLNMDSKTNPILANKDFRKALYWGLDRETLHRDLFKTNVPAVSVIGLTCVVKPGVAYMDTEEAKAKLPKNNGYDQKTAKEYFDKAYAANGNKKITMEFAYSESQEILKKTVEFMEQQYEGMFGKDRIDVKLKAVPSNAYFELARKGQLDAFFCQYGSDEINPWNMMMVYTSDFQGKIDNLKNDEFDKLYKRCTQGDLLFKDKEKLEALVRMDEILREEVNIIPMIYRGNAAMFSDRIKLKTKDGECLPVIKFAVLQADIVD